MSFRFRRDLFFAVLVLWNVAPVAAGPIDVTFDATSGGLFVSGSTRADTIKVTQKSGQLVLTAGAGSTVNGRRELKFSQNSVRAMGLFLDGGADTLTLEKIDNTFLFVDMGDGSDRLILKQYRRGDEDSVLQVHLGAGNDTFIATDIVWGQVFVNAGDGHDTVTMSRIECSTADEGAVSSLYYDGGAGNDSFSLSQCTCQNIDLFGGGDNDVTVLSEVIQPPLPAPEGVEEARFLYSAGNGSFGETARWDYFVALDCALTKPVLYGGNGNDTMYVADSTLDGDWTLFMGFEGNDSWESTRCHFPKALPSATVNGWTGRDRFVSTLDTFDMGRPVPIDFEFVQFR